jgi:hypothetical protein
VATANVIALLGAKTTTQVPSLNTIISLRSKIRGLNPAKNQKISSLTRVIPSFSVGVMTKTANLDMDKMEQAERRPSTFLKVSLSRF